MNTNNMTIASSARERRALILRRLQTMEEVSVSALSRETGISEVTIRKDLTALQEKNLLVRTRGGAIRKPVENLNEDTLKSLGGRFNARLSCGAGWIFSKRMEDKVRNVLLN